MKTILSETDPEAFDFVLCEVVDKNGSPGPKRWLCDVVRVIDALDETASIVGVDEFEASQKVYNILESPRKLIFKDNVIGSAHVFRMAHLVAQVVCDSFLRDACKCLKGIQFDRAVDPHGTTPEKWIKHLRRGNERLAQLPLAINFAASGKLHLALELVKLAKSQAGTGGLREAISLLREVITSGFRPSRPDLAKVYNDLGAALLMVNERDSDNSVIQEAINAFQEAEVLASTPAPGFRYEGSLLQIAEVELKRAQYGLKQACEL